MGKANAATPGDIGERIRQLQATRGGHVPLGEVAELVEGILGTLEGDISVVDLKMQRELTELVDYIRAAKLEISAIRPDEIKHQHITQATDELDAVVKATEVAANSILEAAETLTTLANELGGDAAERINVVTTQIYEASSFQDITGQRITKVVRMLRHIEERIVSLAAAFGHPVVDGASDGAVDQRTGEAALLNGPQMPERASSQDDIDALLASLDN